MRIAGIVYSEKEILCLQRCNHCFLFLSFYVPFGCENRYYDEQFKIEVQQLDSDLENRWSTNGVVVIAVESNGAAASANLEEGELISYVIGEYSLSRGANYGRAAKNAMRKDNNFILRFTDGRTVRLAVRRSGDKTGLKVDGNTVSEVKQGSPRGECEYTRRR